MERTAVTGIGVVSPFGLDKGEWFHSLCAGRQILNPVKSFETRPGKSSLAVQIQDFDPTVVLKVKGLQFFGRTHLLAAVAAHLALSDAGPLSKDFDLTRMGVVLAMTFGTVQNITGFYDEALLSGPSAVSPVGFANTVANSPASRTAILLGARGVNATLAHGETAGLEALDFSAHHLAAGSEQLILAGSAYGLCQDMYRAYGARGLLSPGANGGQEQLRPMDSQANGVILGEMAVVLALENPDTARARGARIYGFITGHAQGFDPSHGQDPNLAEQIVSQSMRRAIQKAGLSPNQITWVAAAANSHPRIDALEARALRNVFNHSSQVRVAAIKSISGECFDVAGPQGVAAALLSMALGVVPPTANLKNPRNELPAGCCTLASEPMTVHHVLVNALAFSGGCSSVVVSSREP